jgi:NAD(P)-dependent dehydrogenase (short-subunit alcohol dehydrogenase family)
MEGAESTIVYLPEEEKDARDTQRLAQEKGGSVHLVTTNLRSHQTCKNVVDEALDAMGTINILELNHGFQMMQETIGDISECAECALPRQVLLRIGL